MTVGLPVVIGNLPKAVQYTYKHARSHYRPTLPAVYVYIIIYTSICSVYTRTCGVTRSTFPGNECVYCHTVPTVLSYFYIPPSRLDNWTCSVYRINSRGTFGFRAHCVCIVCQQKIWDVYVAQFLFSTPRSVASSTQAHFTLYCVR